MDFKNAAAGIFLMVASFAAMSICSTIVLIKDSASPILIGMIAISAITLSVGIFYYRKYTSAIRKQFQRLDEYDAVYAQKSRKQLKEFQSAFNQFKQLNNSFTSILKQQQHNSLELSSFLASIIEQINVGIIIAKRSGEVELINQHALKILNLKELDSIIDLHDIDSTLAKSLNQYETGEQNLIQVQISEKLLNLSIHHSEIQLGNSTKHLISIKNIESELAQNEMESWQRLVKIITHEIMNSLTPIITLSKTIEEDLTTSEKIDFDDIKEGIAIISSRSEGLKDFVENYRSLTHIPTPKFELIGVHELFERINNLLSPKFEDHRINFKIEKPQTNFNLLADKHMIEQVLINLIVNSIDALQGISRAEIIIQTFSNQEGKGIKIIDNGPGIPLEMQEKIFAPFYTSKTTGTGVGLALCKYIMSLHKGKIQVESKNRRTEFKITF